MKKVNLVRILVVCGVAFGLCAGIFGAACFFAQNMAGNEMTVKCDGVSTVLLRQKYAKLRLRYSSYTLNARGYKHTVQLNGAAYVGDFDISTIVTACPYKRTEFSFSTYVVRNGKVISDGGDLRFDVGIQRFGTLGFGSQRPTVGKSSFTPYLQGHVPEFYFDKEANKKSSSNHICQRPGPLSLGLASLKWYSLKYFPQKKGLMYKRTTSFVHVGVSNVPQSHKGKTEVYVALSFSCVQ